MSIYIRQTNGSESSLPNGGEPFQPKNDHQRHLHLQISWGEALAAGLPASLCLPVTLLVIFTNLHPPEIKYSCDNKTIAKGLCQPGPRLKTARKMRCWVALKAALHWIFCKSLGLDESTPAIVVMATSAAVAGVSLPRKIGGK